MFEVDQIVGVVRYGNWGGIFLEGLYRVTKSNKVRTHLTRDADGYQREFSAKTGVEKGADKYRSASIVTEEKYRQIEAQENREKQKRAAWGLLSAAVNAHNFDEVKKAVAQLESL